MGGGGPGKADKVGKFRKGGCMKMRTRGGEGKKIRKFCGRHLWKPPYVGGHYQFTNTIQNSPDLTPKS